jgi:hypothetical protein
MIVMYSSCRAWKKQTQIINLKPLYSDKFCRSSKFRERVCRVIENAQEQLVLTLYRSGDPYFDRFVNTNFSIGGVRGIFADRCLFDSLPCFPLDYLSLRLCQVKQFDPESRPPVRCFHCNQSRFEDLSLLDVSKLKITEEASFKHVQLQNYETLGHLHSLSLTLCDSTIDVSCFRNIAKLTIRSCAYVTDVSSLGNVHELALTFCHGITDVSSLGRVYNLNLSGCENIRDVSALGNVHILNLDSCPKVTDVSALTNVYELHLCDFKGVSIVGLENVVILFLTNSHSVKDISMLKKVEVLHVECCYGVHHFHGLDCIKELSIGDNSGEDVMFDIFKMQSGIELFDRLTDFHACELILRLEEEGEAYSKFFSSTSVTWKHFLNLKRLSLNFCCFRIFPNSLFQHLTTLSIIDCEQFGTLMLDLPCLRELFIRGCESLGTLHLIPVKNGFIQHSPVRVVEISADYPMQVTISRKVHDLIFLESEEQVQLIVENTVQRLKVTKCPNFRIRRSSAPIYNIVYEDDSQPEVDLSLTNYVDDD